MEEKSTKGVWSLRRKLVVFIPVVLIVVGLALGLGLGLTIGRNDGDGDGDDDGNNPSPTITASPLPTPTGTLPWTPRVNDTWQIVLQSNILLPSESSTPTLTPNVSIYDIDLFENSKETIDTLHRLGKKVICYFSAGSYEPGRPDSAEFKEGDLGKVMDGWPDEKWLRLDNDNVRRIMRDRVELAGNKGCDGVDPDNIDGYQNDNGLSLTAQSSIDFVAYLSSITQPLNLTLGLKNAGDIITAVLPVVHFSVNEQCVEENECTTFHQFIDAGKPVFHIEYPDGAGKKLKSDVVTKFCGRTEDAQGIDSFSTVLKKMDLDGWIEYCDGTIEVTSMNQTERGN
ncbi:hypothetical protein P280DRAFT_81196 [Massarina eburnea CBS 473.64]|uniref:alpha-galactosidase n=1 Tax=Massarina eburnea CBS 473.64 TaxID=1395130 RepID=A0A6A6RSZ3_9PLEO|nr:hypothetical protein P280DRAFT_81196 [Massarina eburnea CBS 473.64]